MLPVVTYLSSRITLVVRAKFRNSLINILAVGAYGEAEFWLSGGKVILIFSLFFFTFITMVGGNPQGDAYGFRHWKHGGAFRESITTGDLGRFEGFLAAHASAAFTVVGPEYISMVAAEAKRPRIYIKAAFKMVYIRFGIFFIGGALAVGIVCSSRGSSTRTRCFGRKQWFSCSIPICDCYAEPRYWSFPRYS